MADLVFALRALGLSPEEVAAIITACSGVIGSTLLLIIALVPILFWLLRRMKRVEAHTKETVDQVSNDHSTNLRVENDERHAETIRMLRTLDAQVRASDRRNGRRNAATNRRVDKLADRLDLVEDTIPRPTRRTR